MSSADRPSYGTVFARLLNENRLMPLDPGAPNEPARPALEALDLERAFAPSAITDPMMAEACRSALWLYHDFIDISHTISQKIETPTGSYWHGIMHRREPDYTNCKYWFRRVGEHPVYPDLREAAARLAREEGRLPDKADFLTRQSDWDPFAFIDLCEAAHRGSVAAVDLCRRIQQREWDVLFDYCYRQATRTP
jgi:hypothetical protein